MSRIERLTAEQSARMSEFRDKWLAIGLSTERADRANAEAGIVKAYLIARLPAPKIVWCGSPLGAGLTRAILQDKRVGASVGASVGDSVRASVRASVGDSVGAGVWASVWASVGDSVRASVWDSVGDSVRASVGDSVRASVWDSVRASVRASVGDSVRASVGASVWAGVWASVGASVGDSVWDSVWDSVGDSVWDSVRASVGDSVGASVWDSVRASVGDSVGASVWDSGYGQHDAAWLGFYEYFHDVCGLVLQSEKLAGLWMVAKSAGWFLPHQNICWISERHNICKLDDRGRIHSEAGPSIAYPDGFAIFAWRGVRVPRQVIDSPDSLKPEQIRDEQNAEVRRVMMTRFGEARYLQGIGGKKIHEDELGELFLAEVPGDEPLVMVKVINSTPEPDGSRKPYFLRVPPDMRVASQAVAWTFGYENWQQYAENLVAQT